MKTNAKDKTQTEAPRPLPTWTVKTCEALALDTFRAYQASKS
jgi:hypothetical protein